MDRAIADLFSVLSSERARYITCSDFLQIVDDGVRVFVTEGVIFMIVVVESLGIGLRGKLCWRL